MGVWGGILLFSPTVWVGSGGERRDAHTHTHTHTEEHTHTGTYTQMLHLPFSDLPGRSYPLKSARIDFRLHFAFHSRCRSREILFCIYLVVADTDSRSLQLRGGSMAYKNYFRHIFDFIADIDTGRCYRNQQQLFPL